MGKVDDDYTAEAARIIELLPDGKLIHWPGCGHGMHYQFPQRFVDTVKEFFAEG